jgi:hypothetical protein
MNSKVKLPYRVRFLTVLLVIGLFSLFPLFGEEYYSSYFHFHDKHNFDSKPQMNGKISEAEAKESGNYTVVRRDEQGKILEAVSMIEGKPDYYFAYYYNEDDEPILRKMNAFFGEGETPLNKVVYSYDESGNPLSVAYYTYTFFEGQWKIQYLKEYSGANYRVFDYSTKEKDRTVERKLEEVNEKIEQIQELEQRNILKKMLGIR